ncbi:MAG TPA: FtsX-like permease family protein [Bryobacteraceae bacterium]|nr:FtsX-like permease family protein [Bryobacteraceae bacterium]
MDSTLPTERLLSALSSMFGVLALILASIELYGVLSDRIEQHRHSIGIRMALGTSALSVVFSVVRQSGRVIVAGLVVGIPVAFGASRAAESMLWGLKPSDPTSYLMEQPCCVW